ncbi:isoprenyl transferase [Arachidicoccus sp.]|uniref:isoprenyl transferase n=1 Tax=Arachidicoccus sp. TaxID=1872624 RepID=UPI003D21F5CF
MHLNNINKEQLPKHVAIIMDGNGRWAQEKGEDRLYGHFHGVNSVRAVAEGASEIGIEYLTLYAFSTENWDRPQQEVNGLMELLIQTIRKEVPTLNENNIRLRVIGDLTMLPQAAQDEMNEALIETQQNSGLKLILALSYSSRWELAFAIRNMAKDIECGKLSSEQINQTIIEKYLTTSGIPDPELLIRTGGERRVSNFLLYQIAYTELYFTDTKWPDFDKEKLFEAIVAYQNRERRFGKTGEQIKKG